MTLRIGGRVIIFQPPAKAAKSLRSPALSAYIISRHLQLASNNLSCLHQNTSRLLLLHRSSLVGSTMSRAAEAAMAASYKQLKEDFVSGLAGGDILEINYVTAVAPVSLSSPE